MSNILTEHTVVKVQCSCSSFILKTDILAAIHENVFPWQPTYSKYQSFRFICYPNKNSPVFPSQRHSLYIEMDWTSMAIFSRILHLAFCLCLVVCHILLLDFFSFLLHCSYLNAQVIQTMAPAHLRVYPALFIRENLHLRLQKGAYNRCWNKILKILNMWKI